MASGTDLPVHAFAKHIRVRVEASPEQAQRRVVHVLAKQLREWVARRGGVRMAVAGGSVLPALAATHAHAPELWPLLKLTFADERAVARDDARSNRGEAARCGALHGPSPALCLELLHDDEVEVPRRAFPRVEHALAADFGGALDLTLLGLGEDGHVASLFPGRFWGRRSDRLLLVNDAPKPPPVRVSLTHAFLATARAHVVLAVGSAKAEAIARLFDTPGSPLHGLRNVRVFTDRAGASLLPGRMQEPEE